MVTLRGRRVPLVPLVLVVALAAYGAVRYLAGLNAIDSGIIEGSGTIEATQVHIAAKAPGRVLEVMVGSGDEVVAGDVLVRFDRQEVDAQIAQAEAAVSAAQARSATSACEMRAW
ncbi:MAG: biotin/lipoyl-binding protein, partial [bacterium]|nr:biotin/lipoyl-binding protein [bacterium]